jgi:hypothetical protein
MSQAVEDDSEEVEVVELDDDSVSEGDPKDQTRQSVLVHLLLALAGTGVLKQGLSNFGSGSSMSVNLGLSVGIYIFLGWHKFFKKIPKYKYIYILLKCFFLFFLKMKNRGILVLICTEGGK